MKKTFVFAVAAACVLASCNNQAPKMDEKTQTAETAATDMKIAYVEVDSIMSQYKFCKEYTKILEKKSQNIQNTINQKGQSLQAAAVKFVKFVISKHGGYEMTKQTGELSCVKGALDETNLDAKQLEAVELILNSTQPALWQDNVTDAVIADAFMAGGQLILTGDKTAEEVMKDVQTAAASIK